MNAPKKLLVIDDNEEILISLNRYLSKKQYDVVSVNNGLDALKLLEASAGNFDLVITDLVMPNISGVAVTAIIKKQYPQIPVIAITGYGEQPEALAKEVHADLVMDKPFKLNILGDNIQNLLNING
jgi:CheY-like chemotaxis protein